MSTPAEHRAALAAQVRLYGRQQPPALPIHRPRSSHSALSEMQAGSASLAAITEAWGEFLPTPAALAGAVATLEGLRRVAAELAVHCGGALDG